MTSHRLVLDADGLSALTTTSALRALIERHVLRGGDVWVAAVTIAEVARGQRRTALVHQALRQRHGGSPLRVRHTDEQMALLVGAILHGAGRGSDAIADAHVVATCAPAPVAMVITSDPDDIATLGLQLPGVRVVTRSPT